MARNCIILILLIAVNLAAREATPPSTSDISKWQSVELRHLNFRLPIDFKKSELPCYHPCDRFLGSDNSLTVSYGETIAPSNETLKLTEFREHSVRIDGLSAFAFSYLLNGEYLYVLSIPSDRLGVSVATFRFRSKDATILSLAPDVISTIRIKMRLTGQQQGGPIFVPCKVPVKPKTNPWVVEKLAQAIRETSLKNSLEGWKAMAHSVEERGISFRLTPENENLLKQAGAGEAIFEILKKVEPRELDQQIRQYEAFLENYNSRELSKMKASSEIGRDFLNRWNCDPLWTEQVAFIRAQLGRIESRIGFLTLY